MTGPPERRDNPQLETPRLRIRFLNLADAPALPIEQRMVIGGRQYELHRATARITKAFNSLRFPRDDHVLTLRIEDRDAQVFDLAHAPDIAGSRVRDGPGSPPRRLDGPLGRTHFRG